MVAPAESTAGTDNTSLLPEGRFHRPATTCWPASGAGAVDALTRGRNAATIARPSHDRLPDRDLPAASKHLAAKANMEDTSAAHRECAGSVWCHVVGRF
jgi:hypothetical protein